ncbi:Rho termination factor N-terminal domain-containing protein [Bernardetia sp. Wsw4-3y2]|uniref:Rho termination factor N-terminal domain-containing protein n=1 Tax=Bernardetia sp. Wsw4-3y2 TaxID=3127471 RepID=UPI0030D5DBE7
MIIKSLFEIAFYSSLLVAKKVGTTIGENLPFSEKKKQKKAIAPLKTVQVNLEEEQVENNQVTKKEKGTTPKSETKAEEPKKITPKQEAKIMNYSLKTKKELYKIAQEIDLEGRSTMNKAELIKALREHSEK